MDAAEEPCFLAIVMQHSIAEYIYRADIEPTDSTMLTMMYHLTRFGTPTFVFLSAVLMFYNYDGKLNYFAFIRKRLETVFVPFLFWTIVYWLYVRAFTPSFWQKGGQDWGSLLRELVQPQAGYQLWFILMIIQFYICFPLLAAIYRGAKNKINLLDEGRRTGSVLAILAFSRCMLYHPPVSVLLPDGLLGRTNRKPLGSVVNAPQLFVSHVRILFCAWRGMRRKHRELAGMVHETAAMVRNGFSGNVHPSRL